MPKLVNNLGKVFHKYSFIANALNTVSAVGVVFLTPLLGHIPIQTYAMITGFLAVSGMVGSFIKQEIEEYEDELKDGK